ncbi:Putative ribonuclease H protein [Dendrobium catenatum]|uniref:Ribonuclease H protein n=1 Tax=Dendrobium catenatum TaxID=906689 RepID=A0A2I0WGE8_9ASPA|nr:Putative ribonuclease H protein [Dendrobium catenatum]
MQMTCLFFVKLQFAILGCFNIFWIIFFSCSGLHVNQHKSMVIFSKDILERDAICNVLDFPFSQNTITYLGIPISITRLSNADFFPLLHKVSDIFSGWKAKILSFVGRVQFLKFSITNYIACWIRGMILHKYCFKFIRKSCSKFLFHGNIHSKNMHLIAWKNMCKAKCYGLVLFILLITALLFGEFLI